MNNKRGRNLFIASLLTLVLTAVFGGLLAGWLKSVTTILGWVGASYALFHYPADKGISPMRRVARHIVRLYTGLRTVTLAVIADAKSVYKGETSLRERFITNISTQSLAGHILLMLELPVVVLVGIADCIAMRPAPSATTSKTNTPSEEGDPVEIEA